MQLVRDNVERIHPCATYLLNISENKIYHISTCTHPHKCTLMCMQTWLPESPVRLFICPPVEKRSEEKRKEEKSSAVTVDQVYVFIGSKALRTYVALISSHTQGTQSVAATISQQKMCVWADGG